jgi:HAE1 family hydrophobic/amphiphilic exporter-1
VRSDVAGGAEEIAIEVDPERAATTGLSPEAIAGALATLVGEGTGATLGETPVSVGVPDEAADSVEEIRALPLAPGLAVGDVADVREVEAPAARSRVDGEPAVQVTGRITGQDTQSVSARRKRRWRTWTFRGTSRRPWAARTRTSRRASGICSCPS